MARTPGLIVPSANLSVEEAEAEVKRIGVAAGYTPFEADAFAHSDQQSPTLDDILAHYGVKGMHWGVRKDRVGGHVSLRSRAGQAKAAVKKEIGLRTSAETTVRAKPGQMVRVVGGNKRTAHEDAIKARVAEQIAKKNTLDALSNKDLQHLVQRMNLEAQYRNLAVKETRKSAGEKAVGEFLDSPYSDVAFTKLGPHAAIGKKITDTAFKQATKNKALLGGIVKEDKKKDKEDKKKDS